MSESNGSGLVSTLDEAETQQNMTYEVSMDVVVNYTVRVRATSPGAAVDLATSLVDTHRDRLAEDHKAEDADAMSSHVTQVPATHNPKGTREYWENADGEICHD